MKNEQCGERGVFLVRNILPSGREYWHGFRDRPLAEDFAGRYIALDAVAEMYFGAVPITQNQVIDTQTRNGCVLEQSQMPVLLMEI